jgi:hypothetical protein
MNLNMLLDIRISAILNTGVCESLVIPVFTLIAYQYEATVEHGCVLLQIRLCRLKISLSA